MRQLAADSTLKRRGRGFPRADWPALLLGIAMTLCIRGYQFGEGNHTVYLLDALRHSDRSLLASDWWTNSTLQYHPLFTWLASGLMKLGIIRPAFLMGYLGLVAALHLAWLRLTLLLGMTRRTYLLSVVLFYASAAGLGLGVYHFLQDSSMLPSNLANVALLWGLCWWIEGKRTRAGIGVGLAATFHLNHAIIAVPLWLALEGRSALKQGRRGSAIVLGLTLASILPLTGTVLSRSYAMPLEQFVDLYVRLRHAHHYDPLSWGWVFWLAFLWPMPLAAMVFFPQHKSKPRRWASTPTLQYAEHGRDDRGTHRSRLMDPLSEELRRTGRVFAVFVVFTLLALLGAGIWYFNETLIQLSLYRFSIYLKLASCIAAAHVLGEVWRIPRWAMGGAIAVGGAAVIAGGYYARLDPAAAQLIRANTLPVALFAALACFSVCIGYAEPSISSAEDMPSVAPAPLGMAPGALNKWWASTPTLQVAEYGRDGRGTRRFRFAGALAFALAACVGVMLIARGGRGIDLGSLSSDDAEYRALCDWARDPRNTPRDAVFLVPPEEMLFRLRGQRAIVVNFKGIPQLSAEIAQWRRRLADVLGMDDLDALPRRFDRARAEMARRYDAMPGERLAEVARRYGATYIVVRRPIESGIWPNMGGTPMPRNAGTPMLRNTEALVARGREEIELVHVSGRYHLYRLAAR